MSTFDSLRDAIANQRPCLLTTTMGRRTVLPLRIYQQPDGTFLLECYQISGVSKWKMPRGFKYLRLEDIRSLLQSDDSFDIPDGFNPSPKYKPGRAVAQVITPPPAKFRDAPGQLLAPFLADVPLLEDEDPNGQFVFPFFRRR